MLRLSSPEWQQIWLPALVNPNPATFERIAARYEEERGRIIFRLSVTDDVRGYVLRSAWLGFIITFLLLIVSGNLAVFLDSDTLFPFIPAISRDALLWLAVTLLMVSGMLGGLSMLGFMLVVWLRNLVARMLGGWGTYPKLAYTCAAYFVPLALVMGLLRAVPLPRVLEMLMLARALYGLVLSTFAVRVVHNFGWGKAIIANAIPTFMALAGFGLLVRFWKLPGIW